MIFRRLVYCFLPLFMFGSCSLASEVNLPAPDSSVKHVNSIVAIVNDDVILSSELDKEVAQAQMQARAHNVTLPSQDQLKQKLLKQLIYKQMQMQMVDRLGLTVSKEQVQSAMSRIAQQQQLTMAQFKEELSKQGIDFSSFEQQVRQQLLITKLQKQAIGSDVKVTEQQINDAREVLQAHQQNQQQFNLIDVLIPLPSNPTVKQKQQAETVLISIRKQLQSGVAIDAIKGGEASDLGWRSAQQLPAVFVEQIKTLQPGEVTKPFSAPNGLHVLLLKNKKGESKKITNEQAEALAYQQQYNKLLAKWLRKIYEQSYVKIMNVKQ